MKIHLFHLSPHGITRALCQLKAGYLLCRRAGANVRDFIPDSVNSMTAAWNFNVVLKEYDMPAPRTIIDIGANTSQMTKMLKLSCEHAPTVLSFEPHPKLTPIGTKFELALSNVDGETEFSIPQGDEDWGTIKARPGENANSFKVKTARFDSLVQSNQIDFDSLPKPIMVKVDTEGSEFDAIQGFGDYIKKVDYLLVEVENREVRGGNYTGVELCGYLASHGFNCSKVLYACYDGAQAPSYLDTLFWRSEQS